MYCVVLRSGSKMKERKSEQFLSVPNQMFPHDRLQKVYGLVYKEGFDCNIENILTINLEQIGLFHLSIAKDLLNRYLNSVLDLITNNIDFQIVGNRVDQ